MCITLARKEGDVNLIRKNFGEKMEFIEERRTRKRLKKLKDIDITIGRKGSTSNRGNAYRHTKTGMREDLGLLCRSAWEANFARVLFTHGIEYEFEPKVFNFPIKKGTKAYIPDFYLPATDEWVEIKGYLDNKSRIKLKRFRIYYPTEASKLYIMTSKYAKSSRKKLKDAGLENFLNYEDLFDYAPKIPTWEGKPNG